MNTVETLKKVLAKRVDISKFAEDSKLSSLGLDSLDLVEVMLEIEDELHVEFTSEELSELITVKNVIDLINKKIK